MEIVQSMVTANPCYTAGKKITVKGLVLHSVGCPQPVAEVFVKKFNSRDSKVCVHAFIDANTGKVYQTLPWDYRAWHCGGSGNSTHIGVEMCEPSCIKYTGGATITCSDEEKARETVQRTLHTAVELFAFLCKQFGLNPLQDGVIVSHKEGHDRGMASGHGDPDHLFNQLHMNYSMNDFRKAVSEAMGNGARMPEQPMPAPAMPEQPVPAPPVPGQPIPTPPPVPGQPIPTPPLVPGQPVPTPPPVPGQPVAPPPGAQQCGNGGIHAGDIVTLAPDSVYYTGGPMPVWVKTDRWIIKYAEGERAVLGQNVSGSHEINSPIHIKYLTVVSAGQTDGETQGNTPAKAPAPVQPGRPVPGNEMNISDCGVELIAKYEGCCLDAYKCPAGVWTIGYGHTAGVKQGDKLPSTEAARALLKEDLKKYGGYVNNCVKDGSIAFGLTQNQFDALTSFCYNCGNGSLHKLVSGRNAVAVADKLLEYNKGGGKVLAGLTRRREEERALFLS